jgi:hypothetical protein
LIHTAEPLNYTFAGSARMSALGACPNRQDHPRARHALMLSYASSRRRHAAEDWQDEGYWKAGHPQALARARALRAAAGFTPLP